jgi:hypothetical protein
VCGFFPELALDRLAMDFLNPRMAFGAGLGNVAASDGGVLLGVRQDVVRGVAGGAIRRHDQALLQQALAVNALGVVLDDVVLFDRALRLHRRALAMALAAGEGHLQG